MNLFLSRRALVLFHGYPCDSILDSKNKDIAEIICKQFNIDCYILHYEGLGKSNGSFSFKKSITDGIGYVEKIKAMGYENISIYGHSWGGLVALNASIQHDTIVKTLILASPFSIIPDGDDLVSLCRKVFSETSSAIPSMNLEEMIIELSEVNKSFNPVKLFKNAKIQRTFLIQAENDLEVPLEVNRFFYEKYKEKITEYSEWDCDHNFTKKRSELAEYIGNKIE